MKVSKWKNYLMENNSPLLRATLLIGRIKSSNYSAFIVGGAPRDMILGKPINDIDIATNCPMEVLDKLFNTYNIGQSHDFGIVLVRFDNSHFEVAQFRKDGEYEDGRRPREVQIVNDLRTDIGRRDFTINALALDGEGIIIDYVNGMDDIKDKIVRTVGSPFKRFDEDHLRMIRAARFGAMEGFKIEHRTQEAIVKMSKAIRDITPQRIRLELIKAAEKDGKTFARFIALLDYLTLLQYILPEVSNLKQARHKPEHHPEGVTVFDHVIKCLEISEDDYLSRLAILFHDIGKIATMTMNDDGPGYYHHAHVGAKMVEAICDRLKFSSFQTGALVYATRNHMKWNRVLEMKPAKIARVLNSPYFEVLVNVCRADEFSRGEKFMHKGQFEKQLARVLDIKTKWESRMIDYELKLVDGEKIMALTGLKPGPLIGEIKEKVENLIIDKEVDPDDQNKVDELIVEVYNGIS